METILASALVGLSLGAVYAAIAVGVIVTYRGTGVINFATGVAAAWAVYVFDELRRTGTLELPVVLIPGEISLGGSVPAGPAIVLALLSAALLGLLAHVVVFRPLRAAPVLAKVVASVGLMLTLQALIVIHFSTTPRIVAPILAPSTFDVGATAVPVAGIWLAVGAVLLAAVAAAFFRTTRYGLAISGGSESERAISLAGYSPQLLAAIAWAASGAAVAAVAILASPTTALTPDSLTFAVVPGMAAAVVARLRSVIAGAAAGLLLGMAQAVLQYLSNQPAWPEWGRAGATEALPFLIIIAILCLFGRSLPARGDDRPPRLPRRTHPRHRPLWIAAGVALAVTLLLATEGSYRYGLITSLIIALLTLSLVVLIGLVGQISLAQAALAGVGGFALSKLAIELSVPFPLAPLVAALAAAGLGVITGLPALRIRGAHLAVVTLALGVVVQQFLFSNPSFTGFGGSPVPPPRFFGVDLGIQQGQELARLPFAFMVLALVTVCCVAVSNLIGSATGHRMIAVRTNEAASAAMGIDVRATKLWAFGLSCFLAGLGGAMLGYARGQLSGDSFTVLVGLQILAFAYLGGITSVSGALLGGLLAPLGIAFVILDQTTALSVDDYQLVGGVALVLTAIMYPSGMAGALPELRARLRRRGEDAPERRPHRLMIGGAAAGDAATPVRGARRAKEDQQPVLSLCDLAVRFGGVTAVDHVDLDVFEGEIVGLIGPNGAGKTTLVDAVTGFCDASGSVQVRGEELSGAAPHRRARAGVARTWQTLELFDDLTVRETAELARQRPRPAAPLHDLVRPPRLDAAGDILAFLGLEPVLDAYPQELSAGEQKLVGVARALATKPELLLLDEPASGLDPTESRQLGSVLRRLVDRGGPAILLIEHDLDLVMSMCDRIYVLDVGRVIAQGKPADVRDDPAVIAAYLGRPRVVAGRRDDRRRSPAAD